MKKGFTLIELILTVIIVGLIAGVSAQVLLQGIDTYSLITSRKNAMDNARVSMDRMVSEFLLLKSLDISSIQEAQIDFVDQLGGATNFKRVNTIDLYRGNDYMGGPLALLDFDFYKSDGTVTNVAADVRKINIELTIQSLGGYGTIPLRTEVFPRNFMYTNFR